MKPLLLIGAGGHGRVVGDIAELLGWDDIAFLDDVWPEQRSNRHWPIIGRADDLARLRADYPAALVAIGANGKRLGLHRVLAKASFEIPTLAHPAATVSPRATLGQGSVVAAKAVVGAFASLGEAVILNTASSVDHDCVIGDGVHIAPGAHIAGTVTVGALAWIGVGAVVREGTTIGEGATIGAGAVVVSDIPPGVVAVGIPAAPTEG